MACNHSSLWATQKIQFANSQSISVTVHIGRYILSLLRICNLIGQFTRYSLAKHVIFTRHQRQTIPRTVFKQLIGLEATTTDRSRHTSHRIFLRVYLCFVCMVLINAYYGKLRVLYTGVLFIIFLDVVVWHRLSDPQTIVLWSK